MTIVEGKLRQKNQLKRDKQKWSKNRDSLYTEKEKEKQTAPRKHRRFIKRPKWQRLQNKKKQESISAIYNYSDLTLTEPMKKVLNRGLNFCVAPENLNITEALVDLRRFERKMKWKEFFAEEEEPTEEWKPDIFPIEKTNLPNKTSKNLKDFCTSVRSDLLGTKFNKSKPNISKEESEALKNLVTLQREKK